MVFHFRAISPNITSGAQAALMTIWQSCDCYLPPVNGHSLCLTFFSYAFAPSFLVPYFYFPVYFSILAFSSLFALFLIAFPFALFCSSAKPLLNPVTIAGFCFTKVRAEHSAPPAFVCEVQQYLRFYRRSVPFHAVHCTGRFYPFRPQPVFRLNPQVPLRDSCPDAPARRRTDRRPRYRIRCPSLPLR